MAPRPTSPTSLLWAQQIKREHSYINVRMRTLEAQQKKWEETAALMTARLEAVGDTGTKLAELSARISAIEAEGEDLRMRVTDVSKEKRHYIQGIETAIDDVTRELRLLKEQSNSLQSDTKGSAERYEDVVARLGRLEASSAAAAHTKGNNVSSDIEILHKRLDDLISDERRYVQMQDTQMTRESGLSTQTPQNTHPITATNEAATVEIPRSPEPRTERRVLRKAPKVPKKSQSSIGRPSQVRRSARQVKQYPSSSAAPGSTSSPVKKRPVRANSHKKRQSAVAKDTSQVRFSDAVLPLESSPRRSQKMNQAYPHLERPAATTPIASVSKTKPMKERISKNRCIIQEYELPPLSDME